MEKKCVFSDYEYNSLRTELISRIGFIYSQSSTALTTIISTWAAGITLFIFLTGDRHSLTNNAEIIIRFFNSFVFLIPVAFFIPLAIKSGENLTQIASLSAYIRVFFEYIREKSDDTSLPRYGWEISNTLVSDINAYRKNKGKLILMFNEEFTILSIISVIIYSLSAVLNILTIYGPKPDTSENTTIENLSETGSSVVNSVSNILNDPKWLFTIITIYSVFAVLAIITVINIHKSSCTKKNLMDKSPVYIQAYLKRAADLKLINKDKLDEIFGKINPDNRIHTPDGREITT